MEPLDAKACLFLSFDKNKLTPVIHKNCAFHELCQRSLQKKIKTLAPIPRLSNQGCKQKNPARDARGSSFRLFELFNLSRAVEKYHWRDFQRPHSNRPFWHQYCAGVVAQFSSGVFTELLLRLNPIVKISMSSSLALSQAVSNALRVL